MAKTLGVVQLPSSEMTNTRQANHTMPRRFGGKPLLEWVVRRVSDAQHIDNVCVLTDNATSANVLQQLVPTNVQIIIGNGSHEINHLLQAAEVMHADFMVRVLLSQPFIDPVLLDRLIVSASGPKSDYACYCSDQRPLNAKRQTGLVADWFRTSALREANRGVVTHDLADAATFMLARPDRFNIRLCQLPVLLQSENERLSLQSADDWEQAYAIVDALGTDRLDWQNIVGLLQNQTVRI
jgi:spore coat polysaccharide biosynthesis protein SpsF